MQSNKNRLYHFLYTNVKKLQAVMDCFLISDAPVCSSDVDQLIGVTAEESISINCRVSIFMWIQLVLQYFITMCNNLQYQPKKSISQSSTRVFFSLMRIHQWLHSAGSLTIVIIRTSWMKRDLQPMERFLHWILLQQIIRIMALYIVKEKMLLVIKWNLARSK